MLALFRSTDRGESFELVRALWEHPTRSRWVPGGGGEGLHTVITHPGDPDSVTVAVSTAGVFRTKDGGASWDPSNRGVSAVFLPDPQPEFGQCVHKVARDAADPDRLYLQNHWGVYRSDDAGDAWSDIGSGLPSDFGFAVAAHPHRPGTAYVFPLNADSDRVPAEHRCRVFRTEDAGANWEPLSKGLRPGSITARCCGTRSARTTRIRRASTSATATASCTPATTTGTAGNCWPSTCRTCSACGRRSCLGRTADGPVE